MNIDWASLGTVAAVTVIGTAFILTICALAARMLDDVHAKKEKHEVKGLHAAEIAAGFFLTCAAAIMIFGLWLIIPYFH